MSYAMPASRSWGTQQMNHRRQPPPHRQHKRYNKARHNNNNYRRKQRRPFPSQAVNSVNQQPDHQHASGQQPHRGPRRPRQHQQQPHRGQRSQNYKNNKQRKNGTKPFKLTQEMLEIERVEKRLMQLVSVVGTMVGDLNTVVDWAGDQFRMRPIMGYPPLSDRSRN